MCLIFSLSFFPFHKFSPLHSCLLLAQPPGLGCGAQLGQTSGPDWLHQRRDTSTNSTQRETGNWTNTSLFWGGCFCFFFSMLLFERRFQECYLMTPVISYTDLISLQRFFFFFVAVCRDDIIGNSRSLMAMSHDLLFNVSCIVSITKR